MVFCIPIVMCVVLTLYTYLGSFCISLRLYGFILTNMVPEHGCLFGIVVGYF